MLSEDHIDSYISDTTEEISIDGDVLKIFKDGNRTIYNRKKWFYNNLTYSYSISGWLTWNINQPPFLLGVRLAMPFPPSTLLLLKSLVLDGYNIFNWDNSFLFITFLLFCLAVRCFFLYFCDLKIRTIWNRNARSYI